MVNRNASEKRIGHGTLCSWIRLLGLEMIVKYPIRSNR